MVPSPASTVVLVREAGCGNSIETLLLLRNKSLKFEGGAWVFPGGKVDPDDYPADVGSLPQGHGDYLAAINAAIRETREEAGLLITPKDLIQIAHWTTPMGMSRRYATWFFLCPLHEAADIVIDDEEILDYQWLSPDKALALHDEGSIRLPTPTSHTLRSIASYRSLHALCQEMREADIHVFPDDSDYYCPVDSTLQLL
jgi:8-oxo-dGTP pyrophosphatase MutT (NUDIX family)